MSLSITVTGTAIGPGWRYRLERDNAFTPWKAYSATAPVVFDKDPIDGADLRPDLTYFIHAENPDDAEADPLAAAVRVSADGATVAADATGALPLSALPAALTDPVHVSNLQEVLTAGNETSIAPLLPKVLREPLPYVRQITGLVGVFPVKIFDKDRLDEAAITPADLRDQMQVLPVNRTGIDEGMTTRIRKLNDGGYDLFPTTFTEEFDPAALSDAQVSALCARLKQAGCLAGTGTTTAGESFGLTLTHFRLVAEADAPVINAPVGGFDSNDCDKITGWGRNPAAVNTPAVNVIYCDGAEVGRVTSGITRSDVKTYLTNAGVAGVTFSMFGFSWDKPARFNDGLAHTWAVKSVDNVAYDVNATATITCQAALYVVSRRIPTVNVNEGGAGVQVQLVELYNNGQEGLYLGPMVYSLVGTRPGISISPQGVFKVDADSITANLTVEVHIAISNPDTVIIGQVQVINQDCQRESGTETYILGWNFTPQSGGTTRLFSSLDDANNTAGAKFDNTAPGSLATFGVGIKTLAIGQKVYNGTGVGCALVDNNYYYVIANGAVDTIQTAIRTANGIITELKQSTYQTTATPKVVKVFGQFFTGDAYNVSNSALGNLANVLYAQVVNVPSGQKPQIGLKGNKQSQTFWFDCEPTSNAQYAAGTLWQNLHNWGTPSNAPEHDDTITYYVRATPASAPIQVYVRNARDAGLYLDQTYYTAP